MAHEAFATKHDSVGTGYQDRLRRASKIRSSRGQVIVEFAIALPLLLLIVLGVIEMSFMLHDKHIVIRLTREGSNLISRNVSLFDAGTAMKSIVNPPVDLNSSNSKLIFSVLTKYIGSGANYNYVIVYQRCEIGSLTKTSSFTTQGPLTSASFGAQPDYFAVNPGNDTNLRVTNIPATLTLNLGQSVYVTEIYTRHNVITPFKNFGISLPSTIYSIAYF
jgi:hypothetical protein